MSGVRRAVGALVASWASAGPREAAGQAGGLCGRSAGLSAEARGEVAQETLSMLQLEARSPAAPLAPAAQAAPAVAPPPTAVGPVPGRTFGHGLNALACNASKDPLVVLNHTLSEDAELGLMTHFWSTGETAFGTHDSNFGSDEIVLDYFVDGEESPSISFQPSMATGQYYGGKLQEEAFPPFGVFSAGEKMGKNGQVSGWYNNFKVPFRHGIVVKVRTLIVCQVVYVVVRGHEIPKRTSGPEEAGFEVAPGLVVPRTAKLLLQRIDRERFEPLSFVPIFTAPAGFAGVLYLTSISISTSPARNDYIEGCWHLYREAQEAFPGVVLGTGLEDFFDSSYWFCAATTPTHEPCMFAHPGAGLLHFDRSNHTAAGTASALPADYERLSAYRFHDQETISFQDGGRLEWRVGDVEGKCDWISGKPLGAPSAVNLTSYAWAYVWPVSEGPAAPHSPPVGGS